MASTDALPIPLKNVAFRVTFSILDADGDLVTGAAGLDSEVSKDGGTFADCTNEATEIATNSGMYYLDLTNTEMNADCVAVIVKTSTSGAKTTPMVFYPLEDGDWRVNVVQFGGAAGAFSGGRPEVNTTHAAGTAWNSAAIGAATLASDTITAAKIAADAITAAKIADGALAAAKFAAGAFDAVWSVAARLLTAGTNIVLAKGTGVTGFNDLSAAQVNAEADTALADYDPPTRAEATSDTNSVLSKLLKYIQLVLRKDAAIGTDNATEKTAINADGGSGAGAFDQATDAQEAIRDNQGTAQTGDSFARIGAPAGASVSADVAAVKVDTAAIKVKTDNLPTDPADQSLIIAAVSAVETKVDTVDTVVDAIKAKTDNLPTDPADASVVAGLIAAVEAKVDIVDTVVDAVKVKTDNLPTDPADASVVAGLIAAVETKVDTVDGVVDAIKVETDKLADTLEDDGGTFRFTQNALEEAPSGSGASAADIADAVWDEDLTAHTTPDSAGEILGNVATGTPPTAAAIRAEIDSNSTQLTAIKAKTDGLPSDPADASVVAGLIAAVETKVDTVDTVVDAIKAKTDNLPTDPADQSLIIAATDAVMTRLGAPAGASVSADVADIEGKVDDLEGRLTAGRAANLDNLDATVSGRASQASVDDLPTNAELATALAAADDAVLAAIAALNNLSQANIRTAVGLAAANLDTQLGDLPTNAELATALAAADDAVLAAIAALNNLSQANIRTAVGLASANLDTQLDALPTNAELATALAAADDAVLAAISALNNLSAAQVNAQVLDVLAVDTFAEPSAVPAATATLADKINFLAALARNVSDLNKDTGLARLRNAANSGNIGTRTDTDDGTSYVKGAWA